MTFPLRSLWLFNGGAIGFALLGAMIPAASRANTAAGPETIILLRHAEKPAAGLGQLDCQGLNRALALPAILARDYKRIDAIFAPNPVDTKNDGGIAYYYLRPLATIEPTAIALGKTVDISFGEGDWQKLGAVIDNRANAGKTVLAAWEHHNIVKLARWLMQAHGGDAAKIPDWNKDDFDSMYVLHIGDGRITFEHRQEGLNGQPKDCKKAGGTEPVPPDPPSKFMRQQGR